VPAQSETDRGRDNGKKFDVQYNISQVDLPGVLQYEDSIPSNKPQFYQEDNGPPGLDFTKSLYVSGGPALGDSYFYLFDGGVTDKEARIGDLTSDSELSVVDEFNGYTIVAAENQASGAYAISDTTQLQAIYVLNGPAVVRSAIQNESPKIPNTNRTCEILTSKLPDGDQVRLTFRATLNITGIEGYGQTLQYGPDQVSMTHVSVYDPDEADVEEVEAYATSQVPEEYRTSVQTDNRTSRVTGEFPIEESGYPRA